MHDATLQGGCLCGAVRYETQGKSLKVVNCHCAMCRRHSGAAFLTYVAFPSDRVRFTKGSLAQYRSSAHALRAHCARCGSPLTFVSETDRATVWLTAGSLDDPNAVQPTEHWYVASKVPWVRLDDDLPQCPGAPDSH
jgi:hypothetical protein